MAYAVRVIPGPCVVAVNGAGEDGYGRIDEPEIRAYVEHDPDLAFPAIGEFLKYTDAGGESRDYAECRRCGAVVRVHRKGGE